MLVNALCLQDPPVNPEINMQNAHLPPRSCTSS